ncbi:MAG: glucosamine-6-phosphate deaminase [Erysipelotrichaceae bacterium]
MKVIVVNDYQELSERAFEVMKEVLVKENPVLGLATGSSPIGLYQEMVKDYQSNHTSYENVVTFNLDEYANLPKEHSESYYSFMHHNLFDHVNIKEENIHIPAGNGTLEENCAKYEETMKTYTIDLQLLGIGGNGHIGFNEPGTSFDSETHVVELQEKTRKDNARFFDPLGEEVPTHACTMGIASIMRSKKVLLVASGENKADAIAQMVNGEVSEACPATVLQNHPDVVVIVDKAAASKLK